MPGLPTPWMLALLGCVGTGELEASVSGQIVGIDYGALGPGLVLIETGAIHEGAYQYGAYIGDDGRFTRYLPVGGEYGLHLFADGYQYLPIGIEIDDNQQVVLTSTMVAWGVWMDLTGQPTWPTQPSDDRLIRMPWDDIVEDNPVIDEVSIEWLDSETLQLTAEVWDPDGDLSRMILAYDHTTGAGMTLNPPGPPDSRGDYPDGTYTAMALVDAEHVRGESLWSFVVSDNMCNDTKIWEMVLPER